MLFKLYFPLFVAGVFMTSCDPGTYTFQGIPDDISTLVRQDRIYEDLRRTVPARELNNCNIEFFEPIPVSNGHSTQPFSAPSFRQRDAERWAAATNIEDRLLGDDGGNESAPPEPIQQSADDFSDDVFESDIGNQDETARKLESNNFFDVEIIQKDITDRSNIYIPARNSNAATMRIPGHAKVTTRSLQPSRRKTNSQLTIHEAPYDSVDVLISYYLVNTNAGWKCTHAHATLQGSLSDAISLTESTPRIGW